LPWIEDQAGGRQSRYVLLGLGKLGGRELSYHSDLDLMLIYEDDGRTRPAAGRPEREHFESTDNFHYYTELAQRIIKVAGVLGPMGRLYTVDMRLRPTGKSGSLVLPLAEFRRYFAEGEGQLWERQALTRARVVHGEARFGAAVMGAVEEIAYDSPWRPEMASEIRTMRERLEASRNERDVKRGFGGIVDIEFLIQLLQLKYGHDIPELREPNAWAALEALCKYGKLSAAERTVLHDNYDFLRFVESRLRIVHNLLKDELPERSLDLEKLARRLEQGPAGRLQAGGNSDAATRFLREMDERTEQTRELFLQVVEREGKKGG
jgi:glutamate-ammonia-ligase adenylyltransferase